MDVNVNLPGQDFINAYMSSSRKSACVDVDGGDDGDEVDEECAQDLEAFKKWLDTQGPAENVSTAEGWGQHKEQTRAAAAAVGEAQLPAGHAAPSAPANARLLPHDVGNDILPIGFYEGITPPGAKETCDKCGKVKCALPAWVFSLCLRCGCMICVLFSFVFDSTCLPGTCDRVTELMNAIRAKKAKLQQPVQQL